MGVMGGTHLAAYQTTARDGLGCKVIAVCDIDPAKLAPQSTAAGNMQSAVKFDPKVIAAHDHIDKLLAEKDVQLVSICTPTDTHIDLAVAALRAGKHVLLEKPVATTTEPVRALRDAAKSSGKLIMPAMCMRFWPAWEWLASAIADRRFGKLRAMNLQRVGSLPAWANWFADINKSGGAVIDLHIHDADFIRHAVGRPTAVTSAGAVNHITTIYHYDDPSLHVTAQGGWLAAGTPFRMRFIAEFENATADFDISRTPQLLLISNNKSEPVEVSKLNGYDGEVRHLLAAIASQTTPQLRATLDDAIDVAIMLETEQYSAEIGKRVTITWGVDEPPGH